MSKLIENDEKEFFDIVNKGMKYKIIEFIKAGFNINIKDKYGKTPLMIAVHSKPVTKLLLKHNANIHAQDNKGNSALTNATIFNSINVVKKLIEYGSNVNHRNKSGNSPLSIAAKCNFFITAKILIDNGADINSENSIGCTPLIEATENNNFLIVEMLLNCGKSVRIFAHNDKCENVIDIALRQRNEKILNLFYSFINYKNILGESLLWISAANDHFIITDILIRNGADVNSQNHLK